MAWRCRGSCRASIRIGELSRELEKARGARTELLPDHGKKLKTATLAAAGISTSAAQRYEELMQTAARTADLVGRGVRGPVSQAPPP